MEWMCVTVCYSFVTAAIVRDCENSVGMKKSDIYHGNCMQCGSSYNSSAFTRSRRNGRSAEGLKITYYVGFNKERDTRLCNGCYRAIQTEVCMCIRWMCMQ